MIERGSQGALKLGLGLGSEECTEPKTVRKMNASFVYASTNICEKGELNKDAQKRKNAMGQWNVRKN